MAGLVLGLASSPGTAGSSSATCTFGGIRYVGKTSQKRDLCLTLSSKGKIVREYTYDYVDTCGTGTTRALNPRIGVMPVTPTGAFVRSHARRLLQGRRASREGHQHVQTAR